MTSRAERKWDMLSRRLQSIANNKVNYNQPVTWGRLAGIMKAIDEHFEEKDRENREIMDRLIEEEGGFP